MDEMFAPRIRLVESIQADDSGRYGMRQTNPADIVEVHIVLARREPAVFLVEFRDGFVAPIRVVKLHGTLDSGYDLILGGSAVGPTGCTRSDDHRRHEDA